MEYDDDEPIGRPIHIRVIAALLLAALAIGLVATIPGWFEDRPDAASSPGSVVASTSTPAAPVSAAASADPTETTDTTVAGVPAAVTDPVVATGPPTTAVAVTVTPDTVIPTTEVAAPAITGAPDVDAAAYAVYDVATGRFLAERDADSPRAVGSIMKLLTAYVTMQAGDPEHVATAPAMPYDPDQSVIGIYEGQQLSRAILLRAMLIVSANDAATTLAVDLAGSVERFAEMMNQAAAGLGLTNTVAANPVGLDAGGAHSSARDVVTLAGALMQDPTFRETVARTDATLNGQTKAATNELLTKYPGADGVKTGHTTEAGWCIVASATRDGREVLVAVLGSSTEVGRFASATALLDWAFAQP